MTVVADASVTSSPWRPRVLWSPAEIFEGGTQGAWYDPSDLSTLFQDTEATVPAINSGDPVGCILDKSGHDRHARQPVSANRPTLQFDGKALGLLRFNGVNTRLTVAAFDPQSDKVQCVAGLHKNSDTTVAILAEFGVQMPYGAFYLTTSGIYSPEQG